MELGQHSLRVLRRLATRNGWHPRLSSWVCVSVQITVIALLQLQRRDLVVHGKDGWWVVNPARKGQVDEILKEHSK